MPTPARSGLVLIHWEDHAAVRRQSMAHRCVSTPTALAGPGFTGSHPLSHQNLWKAAATTANGMNSKIFELI